MYTKTRAAIWIGLYLGLLLTPMAALLLQPVPAKAGLWWETGVALGFAALAMLALQFLLTARLRTLSAPFGIDVIYYFHRWLAWVLVAVLLLHPLLLSSVDTSLWRRVLPPGGDWRMQSGVLALLCVVLLMLSSGWRRHLHLPYQHWRRLHLLLSLLALGLGFAHLLAIAYYSSPPLVRTLWWLIAGSVLVLVLHVHLLRPWRLRRRPWILADIQQESGDCWTLTLRPQGHTGFTFKAGQFAWLSLGHTPFSLQEHPFSLSSAPRADGSVQFTIKELGDFTRSIRQFQPGMMACVDGPYGVFSHERYPAAPGYVFIGGGIGIAPIIAMLQSLAAQGDQRPHLLFAAHSRFDRIPRRAELVQLTQQLHLKPIPVLEDPPSGWQGAQGWITQELLAQHLVPAYLRHEYFLCGPKPMTDAVEGFLRKLGVARARIHTELFTMA
jgi:predicted ferric reductase